MEKELGTTPCTLRSSFFQPKGLEETSLRTRSPKHRNSHGNTKGCVTVYSRGVIPLGFWFGKGKHSVVQLLNPGAMVKGTSGTEAPRFTAAGVDLKNHQTFIAF